MADVAEDSLFAGAVALAQPSRASKRYRVNVDALLLAAFAARLTPGAEPRPPARAAFDLGAGVGAVSLALLHFGAARHVTLVEVDETLATLAATNLDRNGWSERGEVVAGDVAMTVETRRGSADLVVCNPPYVPTGRGRAPLAPRARARSGDLDVFVAAARALLGRRGRACFVYPIVDAVTLTTTLRRHGLEPKRLAFVHADPAAAARVLLVEACAAKPGGLVVEPPVVERDGAKASAWAAALAAGNVSRASEAGRARSRRPTAR